MGDIVQAVFRALSVFVVYPWLAAVVGVLFVTLGWKVRRWGVVATGAMWLVYAAYEAGMQQRWLCTGECNIRVDLLLIFPVLVVLSIAAARSLHQANQQRESKSRRQQRG